MFLGISTEHLPHQFLQVQEVSSEFERLVKQLFSFLHAPICHHPLSLTYYFPFFGSWKEKREELNLNTKCTGEESAFSLRKKLLLEKGADSSGSEQESTSLNPMLGPVQQGRLSFEPFHLISTWTEPETTTTRLTLAIVLLSGLGSGNFSMRVAERGACVELAVI